MSRLSSGAAGAGRRARETRDKQLRARRRAEVQGGSASAATAAEKDLLCAFAVVADAEEQVSTR